MLFILLITAAITPLAVGGSPCPSRKDIYPCTCANVRQGRVSTSTIVTCNRLKDSDELDAIFPYLRSMDIDQFYLYDSFWEVRDLGEEKRHLPSDWITLIKAKEMEIVDTTLSSCFACQLRMNCRNSLTTRFTVSNSSSSDRMCVLCDTGRGNKQSWIGCMNNLTEFHYNHGKLTSLGVDVFPLAMRNMVTLNLAYNQIAKIDPNALRNLPLLATLDLSHNAIEYIDHIFGGRTSNLVHLDVSWNFIKAIGSDLFPSVPKLKVIDVSRNELVELKENVWKTLPTKLRNINLSNNPLHCDCSIRWINSTFEVGANLRGTCASPEEYAHSRLRRASRHMIERCDSEGKLSSKKKQPKSTTPRS